MVNVILFPILNNLKIKKTKVCKNKGCENEFTPFNSLQKYCSWKCASENKKPVKKKVVKPVPKMSQKRKKEVAIYQKKRIEFLNRSENQICFIEGCNKNSTTIEHRAGRIGKNYLDESTWAGCCLQCNLELERNPEMSKKYQLSKIHDGKKI